LAYVEASVRSRQFVAAARRVMSREGVANASLRAVAAEAEVPLGTLQHVFPSKELLLRAVIEDVVDEISDVLQESATVEGGLAHAVRTAVTTFWDQLVADQITLQLMQYELLNYALRNPGLEHLARWQYQRYEAVITRWCETAADNAGEVAALPYDRLARAVLAGVDGLMLQYASAPDPIRARGDLDLVIDMIIAAAQIRPA
jgi:TetR/AcrR family transcriptional regulator, regulator of biofilm formation and stress response